MTTGYGEFAKGLRQGSLNPQQWAAYLRQQNQMRTAYKQAFSELQAAAQKEGLNIAPPELRNDISQAEAQEKLKAYADQINKDLSYFDVDDQLNTIFKDATASGLNVPRPTQYGKTVKNAVTAKLIIDNYIKKVNQVALQKNLTDAIENIRAQAAQQGVMLPRLPPNVFAGLTEAKAQNFIDNYLKNANNQIAVKSFNDAVSSISAQARAQGVTVAAPAATGITSANVQAKINQYAADVNKALLQKSVSDAIDSIYVQAKGYGVEVSKPSVTGITEANAQAFVDDYLNKVNDALANQTITVSKVATPTSANEKRDPVGPTKNVSTIATPEYIVYDDIGRQVTITQSQLEQMQKAQQNKTWRENYTVIPEEVANSKANWWINSQGLYEWVPVTEADKKKLAERNAYYSRFGQKPKTTLTCGASPSAEYSKEWYTTGGNRVQAKVGSGDLKLQKMKAGSSVNAHASAKTGTAQQAKAISVKSIALANPDKLYDKYGKEIQRVEHNKDARTSTGKVRVFTANLTPAEKIKLDLEYQNRLVTGKTGKSQSTYVNKNLVEARKVAAEALKEAEKVRNAYKSVVALDGKIIDAVQMKGGIAGTGENKVTIQKREVIKNSKGEITDIKVLAKSGTAKEYAQALKIAKANAAIPLTSVTSASDKKAILEARKYLLERASTTAEQTKLQEKFAKADGVKTSNYERFISAQIGKVGSIIGKYSKPGTQGARVSKDLQEFSKKDLSTGIKTSVIAYQNLFDSGMSKSLSPVFQRIEAVDRAVENVLAGTSITISEKGTWQISKKGKESLKGVTFNAKEAKDKGIEGNAVLKGVSDYTTEVYNYAKNRPVSAVAGIGLTVAGGAAAGAVTKGAGLLVGGGLYSVATKVGAKTAGRAVVSKTAYALAGQVQRAINLGLVSSLAINVNNLRKEGDYKNIAKTIVDLSIGGIGFKKGDQAAVKAFDELLTIGAKELPASSIVAKDILTGKENFPLTDRGTPVESVIKSFKNAEGESIGYHASPVPIYPKVRAKVSRPTDQAGLYVTPFKSGPSMYFTRIGKDAKPLGTVEALSMDISTLAGTAGKVTKADLKASAKVLVNRVIGKQGTHPQSVIELKDAVKATPKNIVDSVLGTSLSIPTVQVIHLPKGVKRMPKSIRYDLKATQEAMTKADKGDAFITFKFERNIKRGRAETEATITPNTVLEKINTRRRYFRYNGRVVTLTEYRALTEKGVIPKGQMKKNELSMAEKKRLAESFIEARKKGQPPTKPKRVKKSSEKTVSKKGVTVSSIKLLKSSTASTTGKIKRSSVSTKKPSYVSNTKHELSSIRATTKSKKHSETSRKTTSSKASNKGSSKVSSKRVTPKRVAPNRVNPSRVNPDRVKPTRTDPSRINPNRIERKKPERKDPARKKTFKTVPGSTKPQTIQPIISHPTPTDKGRKQTDNRKVVKTAKELVRFTRKIQNQFGNLETMFGKSLARPVKKTAKKSVKQSTAKPVKKTVKKAAKQSTAKPVKKTVKKATRKA